MKKINKTGWAVLLLAAFAVQSCKKDFKIVTGATGEQVFSTPKGTMGVAVGIQRLYSSGVIFGMCDANGLITNETFLVNPGNASEAQFSSGGGAVDNTNALLGNLWTNASKCIYDADNVINAANGFADKGYASGLIGYATIIKASAYGLLSEFWENVPDTIGIGLSGNKTTFVPRAQGFAKAIAAINNAQSAIAANPISAGFAADLPPGIDIVNGLNALKARYYLFSGNYTAAMATANLVSLTTTNTYNYDAANANPIFFSVTSTNNIYQPVDSTLGLPVGIRPIPLVDGRVPFYTVINTAALPRFRMNGFWNAATKGIPLYVPDEMRLIIAECLLRQASPDAVTAQNIIDGILKRAPGADPYGIGANIAAGYTGASDVASLLTEVYRNRCISLYHSGLKLEDMRRFGRPNSERKRNLFPYPIAERNNNPNVPADPAF
jgi:hypothetical protein